jgi:type IV secretion system protein VirB11
LYVSQNEDRPRPVEPLIAQAVNFVVQIAKTPHGRRVEEIIAVEGYKNGAYEFTRL